MVATKLVLQGYIVDVIDRVSLPLKHCSNQVDQPAVIKPWLEQLQAEITPPYTNTDIESMTLIAGTGHLLEKVNAEQLPRLRELIAEMQTAGFQNIMQICTQGNLNGMRINMYDINVPEYWNYYEFIRRSAVERTVFRTMGTRIGLGPSLAACYDVVAIIEGSRWPYVLRPIGGHHYRLLGACYIHHTLIESAMKNVEAAGQPLQTIALL